MQLLTSSKRSVGICVALISVGFFPVAESHVHHSSWVFSKEFDFPMCSAGVVGGLFLQLQSPRIPYKAGAPLTLGQIADKYMTEAKILTERAVGGKAEEDVIDLSELLLGGSVRNNRHRLVS